MTTIARIRDCAIARIERHVGRGSWDVECGASLVEGDVAGLSRARAVRAAIDGCVEARKFAGCRQMRYRLESWARLWRALPLKPALSTSASQGHQPYNPARPQAVVRLDAFVVSIHMIRSKRRPRMQFRSIELGSEYLSPASLV